MSAIVTVVQTVLRDDKFGKVRAPFRRPYRQYTHRVLFLLGYEAVDIISTFGRGGYFSNFVPLYAITVKRGFISLGKRKRNA